MDLLAFELRRRRGEESRSLMEALPEILADSDGAPPPGTVDDLMPRRLPVEPPQIPGTGRRDIDRALGDDFLTHLPSIDTSELEEIQVSLTEVEREVSTQRRTVFDAYEIILDELSRRYREGGASVDDLL